MKRIALILFALSIALFISCSKEIVAPDVPADDPEVHESEPDIITFAASIELNDETKAQFRAADLKIEWQAGDYIGIATDNNATITAYPVTVDPSDATKATISVSAVDGATAYYALFKGHLTGSGSVASNVFTNISFNTETKTFSGSALRVGDSQVSLGSLTSGNHYNNGGYPLSLAGKSSGTTLIMRPCLALFKVQFNKESMFLDDAHKDHASDFIIKNEEYTSSKKITHYHDYTALRGFDFYQKSASTVYSSGEFTVQIGDNGSLTVAPGETKTEYRRQSNDRTKLTADTPYYMCVIPGGSVSSMQFKFYGFTDNTPTNGWTNDYIMTLSRSLTVRPGDFYDMGKLNPVGRQRTKDHNADEEEDRFIGFTPSINIDGNFGDWIPGEGEGENSEIIGKIATSTGGSNYKELKVAYDDKYIYFYTKRDWSTDHNIWSTEAYIYYGLDLDNDSATSAGGLSEMTGADASILIHPFAGSIEAPALAFGSTSLNGSAFTFSEVLLAGQIGDGYVEFEVRFLRSEIKNGAKKIEDGNTINVYSWGNKDAAEYKSTPTTITISD